MTNDTINVMQISSESASVDMPSEFAHLVCRIFSVHLAIVFLAILLAGFLWYKHRYLIQRYASPTSLLWASMMVFLFGTLVYTIGSLQGDSMGLFDAIYTIPSAIISSLGMFFYQDDISELTDEVKGNSIYMACYSLAHFFAAIIMSFVILRLLGMRIVYWLKMRECCRRVEQLYVFWGINRQSLTLAKSIRERDASSYLVFVNTIDDDADINSIHRLLDLIKIKDSIDERITEIDAIMLNCYEDVADCSVCQGSTLEEMIQRGAKLNNLSRAIGRCSKLHLFFLSNNEDANINSANNVIRIIEKEVQKNNNTRRHTHIYCHAHHTAKTQNLDFHDIVKYGFEPSVHVVDSSALAVESLKNQIEDSPVSFVEIDQQTATVASEFRSVIIGFGETGQATFRFLYEFGAFVDSRGQKTPFHCTIIDEKASRLVGDFYAECPALKAPPHAAELRFEQTAIGSEPYWTTIRQEIEQGVSYIMLSVNNDDMGFNAAVSICRKAVEWQQDNTHRLNIYVRCTQQENFERLSAIADGMKGNYGNINLKVFGDIRQTFTYLTIVNDINLRRAKYYNWEYANCRKSIEACWTDQLNLVRTAIKPTISNIEDSIRRRNQNLSNVLHAATKLHILQQSGRGMEYWKGKSLEREPNAIHYLNLSADDEAILINIARLEHERWMAASRLQGWQPTAQSTDKKDTRRKLHNDMRPWDELRRPGPERIEAQSYDCSVVDTSIRISIEETISH